MSDSNPITVRWWISDTVKSSLEWGFIGGVWGAFNPYPLSSNISKQAVQKFPIPPFSSLSSIGHFGALFASFAFVNRFTTCGSAVVRQQNDYFNDIIGIGAVWGHAYWLFNKSDKRIRWNNRAVFGIAIGSILYANTGYRQTDSVV